MFQRTLLASLLCALALLTPAARSQTTADANEGARLFSDPTTPGAYTFSWWGKGGRTYFLQQSDDLATWSYLPMIEPGADQPIQWGFSSSTPKFFLRLRLSDVPTGDPFNDDFDGDGVSNWDELLQGSDPLNPASYPDGQPARPGNAAAFVFQEVPALMAAGTVYPVTVTMHNVGTTTWTPGIGAAAYALGWRGTGGDGSWVPSPVAVPDVTPTWSETTYRFYLTAPAVSGTYNLQWQMVQGSQGWFGTLTPAATVRVVQTILDAPTDVRATLVTPTEATVSWSYFAFYDGSLTFMVERSADGGITWQTLGTVAAISGPLQSYHDATLAAGVRYQYRVRAEGAGSGGSGSSASPPSVATQFAPPRAPTSVSVDLIRDASDNYSGALISWAPAGDAAAYVIERQLNEGPWTPVAQASTGTSSCNDSMDGLRANADIRYRVCGADASGNRGEATSAVCRVPFIRRTSLRAGAIYGERRGFYGFVETNPRRLYLSATSSGSTTLYKPGGTDVDVRTEGGSAFSYQQAGAGASQSNRSSIWSNGRVFMSDTFNLSTHNRSPNENYDAFDRNASASVDYGDNYTIFNEGRSKLKSTFASVADSTPAKVEGTYYNHSKTTGGNPDFSNEYEISAATRADGLFVGTNRHTPPTPATTEPWGPSNLVGTGQMRPDFENVNPRPSVVPAEAVVKETKFTYHKEEDVNSSTEQGHRVVDKTYTLAGEYSTAAFVGDVINGVPAYPEATDAADLFWNVRTGNGGTLASNRWEYYGFVLREYGAVDVDLATFGSGQEYVGRGGWLVSDVAEWNLDPDETNAWYVRAKYRFHVNPSVPFTFRWWEVFTPGHAGPSEVPAGEPAPIPELVQVRSWAVAEADTESQEYEVDPVTGRLDAAGRPRNGTYAVVLPPQIMPDYYNDTDAVVGDFVPSNRGLDGERHWVVPKAVGQFITFQVPRGFVPDLVDWSLEGAPTATRVPGQPEAVRVPLDAPGKITLRLKLKGKPDVVDTLNVWVVWAEGVIEQQPKAKFLEAIAVTYENNLSLGVNYAASPTPQDYKTGYKFRFEIKPNDITDPTQDIPNLTGPNSLPAPPPGVRHLIIQDQFLSAGADHLWDVSRRMRIEISNPNMLPREKMSKLDDAINKGQPKADLIVEDFPASEVIGNDDPNYFDEDNNPYQNYVGTGFRQILNHARGSITSIDLPQLVILNAGAVNGNTFGVDFRFAEFVRLQIGMTWYRVSDYLNWHHIAKVKFSNGRWVDDGSSSGPSAPTN